MLTARKARPAKLCQYIKADGNFCRSPALRRRRYCHRHIEQRRRECRLARYRTIAKLRADAEEEQKSYVRMADVMLKSPPLKKMILKYFDDDTLRDTFGLNPDGSRL